ncbi:hypothetical protein CEXT_169491 [Caerostris extrusa]|uniref:Uncharacterized protein n=1 Tax=Caerostris extrusa TaxID=172846 RepID=A0AAV4XLN8_CAEEX|nr:hypothetical protein CEXT_169491 [Caerostris extrusa]
MSTATPFIFYDVPNDLSSSIQNKKNCSCACLFHILLQALLSRDLIIVLFHTNFFWQPEMRCSNAPSGLKKFLSYSYSILLYFISRLFLSSQTHAVIHTTVEEIFFLQLEEDVFFYLESNALQK